MKKFSTNFLSDCCGDYVEVICLDDIPVRYSVWEYRCMKCENICEPIIKDTKRGKNKRR